MWIESLPGVLLVSEDSLLLRDVEEILSCLGLRVDTAGNVDAVMVGFGSLQSEMAAEAAPGLILLDARLPGVASGRVLAAMDEAGVHRRSAIALIADQVWDEWIARLREGVIDDIVPRDADAAAWKTHISTMQRGHTLYRELELLREAALGEAQHDPLTGTLHRESMMTLLFRETDRVHRLHGSLSVVLFGVDDFAVWSERLGQAAADALLQQVAKRAERTMRTYDALGRMGADVFLLALPGCSTVNAAMLAERLRMDTFGETFWVKDALGKIAEVRLSGCFAITASRGRSPVVVLREVEQTLALARATGPDGMRCAGDASVAANTGGSEIARLFPRQELVTR